MNTIQRALRRFSHLFVSEQPREEPAPRDSPPLTAPRPVPRADRHNTWLRAHLIVGMDAVSGVLVNISSSGALFVADLSAEPGTVCLLSFWLNGRAWRVEARVSRCQRQRSIVGSLPEKVDLGLSFDPLDARAQIDMSQLLHPRRASAGPSQHLQVAALIAEPHPAHSGHG